MKPMRSFALCVAFLAMFFAAPRGALSWSHQGHMIITRLAALRIIDDPAAPAGLRNFFRQQMPWTLDDCRTLALNEKVGPDPATTPRFNQLLDHWVTYPDQIRYLPAGREKIDPYGMIENDMHHLDLEVFGKIPSYRDDLSNRPDVDQIPHDLSDPRWKRSGLVPWRVEEMYAKLIKSFGAGGEVAQPDDALQACGYLAHYIEDSHQPHHSTVDFNSLSYLIGHIPQLPATTQRTTAALAAMRMIQGVNPHGDLEFQLFEDAGPPLNKFRLEFWNTLLVDIDSFASDQTTSSRPSSRPTAQGFDPFRWDLHILNESYGYLPLVGHAAQAAYASGGFNPTIFFSYAGEANGRRLTIVQLIAQQNAKAVLAVEQAYRRAWASAHRPAMP